MHVALLAQVVALTNTVREAPTSTNLEKEFGFHFGYGKNCHACSEIDLTPTDSSFKEHSAFLIILMHVEYQELSKINSLSLGRRYASRNSEPKIGKVKYRKVKQYWKYDLSILGYGMVAVAFELAKLKLPSTRPRIIVNSTMQAYLLQVYIQSLFHSGHATRRLGNLLAKLRNGTNRPQIGMNTPCKKVCNRRTRGVGGPPRNLFLLKTNPGPLDTIYFKLLDLAANLKRSPSGWFTQSLCEK
ncbi:hypothetical protein VNO77_03282 [Canavalia gladiata]|uniref:Uncharacterized protein n=1 Tax=Canavalia gladiata TaxID=3824 RepID=A0AAN9R801_CANGL